MRLCVATHGKDINVGSLKFSFGFAYTVARNGSRSGPVREGFAVSKSGIPDCIASKFSIVTLFTSSPYKSLQR